MRLNLGIKSTHCGRRCVNKLGIFCRIFLVFYVITTLILICLFFIGDYYEPIYQIDPDIEVKFHDNNEEYHKNKDKVAQEMAKKIRVLCWVMTGPANHKKKAQHVKATWGKRCNILLFISSTKDESLPTIVMPVGEGRNNLWGKTREAFKYVYKNYINEADWFMKADDDTYVILENLRFMLSSYNTSMPLYFGCRLKTKSTNYMNGGAGYVLSKEALRRFTEDSLANPEYCRQTNDGAEDIEMADCLKNVNVEYVDTRDKYGRGRFFPLVPEHHVIPNFKNMMKLSWYWTYVYDETKDGLDCCSDIAISFHYVRPSLIYITSISQKPTMDTRPSVIKKALKSGASSSSADADNNRTQDSTTVAVYEGTSEHVRELSRLTETLELRLGSGPAIDIDTQYSMIDEYFKKTASKKKSPLTSAQIQAPQFAMPSTSSNALAGIFHFIITIILDIISIIKPTVHRVSSTPA